MNTQTISFKLDLRVICALLVLIIIVMFGIWRPWQDTSATTRKITISGEATVKSTPDEFVFSPQFERTGTDLASMKNDLNSFGTTLISDLGKLGVPKSDIVLDSSSYSTDYAVPSPMATDTTGNQTISLYATITVPNQTLAQKVQDYLAGTDATGALTAQPQFSTTKQKALENTARLQAITDARNKATQTAANVGAKLGKVIDITDQSNSGSVCNGGGAICAMPLSGAANTATSSLPVTPGTDEVTADVQVVFALQ